LFNIRYDDGDIDKQLPLTAIHPFRIYNVDERVEGRLIFENEPRWYSARVLESNEERQTSTLVFDEDGEIMELSLKYIRRIRRHVSE